MSTQQNPRVRPNRVVVLGVLAAIACGAGVATQSRINGELGRELGDGYIAALFSFGSGLLIMVVAILVAPSGRRGLSAVLTDVREKRMPWWYLVGGAAGAFFVLSQGLAAALLGIALFTVAVVAGQTVSGLAIDKRGIGSAPPRPITVTRIIGAILVLVAVTLVVSGQLQAGFAWWALIMPFVAGIGIGWQQGVNGQVRVASGSPIAATFINFVVGTAALALAAVVHVVAAGLPPSIPSNPLLYIGGVIGVIFIAVGTIVTPVIGVLLMGLGSVAGQLLTSLLLDVVAPVAEHQIAVTTLLGTVLTLVAVAIAALPGRKPTAR